MKRNSSRELGFTLIELMLVVSIIGILAAVAIPAYQDYIIKSKLAEAAELVNPVRQAVSQYYDRWGQFPKNNAAAGLPPANALRGKYVAEIEVRDGVIGLLLDHVKKETIDGKRVFFQPAVNQANPTSAILWVLNDVQPSTGYKRIGDVWGKYSTDSIVTNYFSR